jgi:carbon storage regulator
MLMMSRRQGESILIGEDIEIVIAHVGRTRVKLGIRAPRTTAVIGQEVKLVRDQNVAAVAARPSPDALSGVIARLHAATGASCKL